MTVLNPAKLSSEIKELALAEGLAVASITSADPFPGLAELLDQRVEAGHLRGMDWFTPERSVVGIFSSARLAQPFLFLLSRWVP